MALRIALRTQRFDGTTLAAPEVERVADLRGEREEIEDQRRLVLSDTNGEYFSRDALAAASICG
jgi:hypothetical protein